MLNSSYKIRTEHLELRYFKVNDLDDMMELRSDPKNTPFAPEDIWRTQQDAIDFYNFATLFYDNNPNRPDWYRYFFAIREINQEKVIGYCGIGTPDFNAEVTEVFYGLLHTKWNLGYGTEAAKAMLNFGFNDIQLDRIIGFIYPDNIGSRRVLEKAGLQEIGVLDNIPKDHIYYGNTLFEITRETFTHRKHDR